MLSKYLRRFGGLILAALLLPGFVTLLSSRTTQAQRRVIIVPRQVEHPFAPWGYRRRAYYVFDNSEAAVNRGYEEGLKTGEGDAKNRRSYDPQRSHYFQEAGFGNFSDAYRSGFVKGYDAGFRS
jgi:hypothetical protein